MADDLTLQLNLHCHGRALVLGGGDSFNLFLGNQNISGNCFTCKVFMGEPSSVTFPTGFQNYISCLFNSENQAEYKAERFKRSVEVTEARKTTTI